MECSLYFVSCFFCVSARHVVDAETDRHVQHLRLANKAWRSTDCRCHRQYDGPARTNAHVACCQSIGEFLVGRLIGIRNWPMNIWQVVASVSRVYRFCVWRQALNTKRYSYRILVPMTLMCWSAIKQQLVVSPGILWQSRNLSRLIIDLPIIKWECLLCLSLIICSTLT